MTAIITKQNVKDKAFIGGGGGSGGDYPTDATFDTIKVTKEATFTVKVQGTGGETLDQDITFANHETRIKTLEQSEGGDYPKDATFDDITVNKNATFKVGEQTITFANHETRISTLEQSGSSGGGSDSLFTSINGYDYFYVRNENIDNKDLTIDEIDYYQLAINSIPTTTIDKLKLIDDHTNVFRFILRKNEIFDESGNFLKEFYCYVEKKLLYCPRITLSPENSIVHYNIEYVNVPWTELPYIALDKRVPFIPFELMLNGEMSIMYLLPQDTIESTIPEIKCDIITARNAFKLHESNVPYLYKPSIITENDTHYIMKFHIGPEFHIPINTEFVFKEFCFMNNWSLKWNGSSWNGENIQGKTNGNMKNGINRLAHGSEYIAIIGASKNEFNNWVISGLNNYKLDDIYCFNKLLKFCKHTINGEFDNGEDFTVERDGLPSFQSMLKLAVYDYFETPDESYTDYYIAYVAFEVSPGNEEQQKRVVKSYIEHINKISLSIEINGATNVFTFSLNRKELKFGESYLRQIQGINDVVDVINVWLHDSNIDANDKSVTLYLEKETCRPRDEINWDPSTNPFQYIVDQQFYSVSPNPNAATTLYTDYNITSSKIITADNITTMRSDLNVVANTTDILAIDIDRLNVKVEKLDDRVTTVEVQVQHIQSELNSIMIADGISMAFTIATSIIPYAPKLLELGGNFLKLGGNAIRNLCSKFTRVASREAEEGFSLLNFLEEDFVENQLPFDPSPLALIDAQALSGRADDESTITLTDLTPLTKWINAEHVDPKFSDKYAETGEDDCNNPDNMYVSYSTVQGVGMYYRDSLKPAFKLVVDRFNDVNTVIDTKVGFDDFYDLVEETPEMVNGGQRLWIKFNDVIAEGEIKFRVTWKNSESNFDDLKITVTSTYEKGKQKSVEISGFECLNGESETELARFKAPVFSEDNKWLVLDAVPRPDSQIIGIDEFGNVELQSSTMKVMKKQEIMNIVYKNDIKALTDRVKILETNGGLTGVSPDFERRLEIVEMKLRNIVIDEVEVSAEVHTLTLEQRLEIIERKCANIEN